MKENNQSLYVRSATSQETGRVGAVTQKIIESKLFVQLGLLDPPLIIRPTGLLDPANLILHQIEGQMTIY